MSPVLVNPSRFAAPGGGGSLDAYYTAVLGDSPWGFWKQLETSGLTLADASGNGRDLTINNTTTLAQTGPDGVTANAIAWPDNDLDYANSSNFLPQANGNAVTLECWVFVPPGGITAITPLMAATNANTSSNMVMFFDVAGKLNGRIFTTSSFLITTPSAIGTGWHHVVHSVGASGQKLRVDKVTLVSSATPTQAGGSLQSTIPLFLHKSGNYANANGHGPVTIALPAAWLTQLSNAQTDAHYDALT